MIWGWGLLEPVNVVVTFERRRWRFGVTLRGASVCPAGIEVPGLGGAAAIGTTPALTLLVGGGKLIGFVAVGPLLVDP